MKRNYIGLSTTFHDSAVAIVDSRGKVVFAEATERYLQYKKTLNMVPDLNFRIRQLIETYCEKDAELVVAHTWGEDHQKYVIDEIEEVKKRRRDVHEHFSGEVPFFISRELANHLYQLESLLATLRQASKTLEYELSQIEQWHGRAPIVRRSYDHHLTHAATACFTSPFKEAVCAIIDGEGEGGRANDVYIYRDGKLTRHPKAPNDRTGSLGIFFWLVCQACGFGILSGEEWKVMGLAPYGELDPDTYKIMKSILKVNGLTIDYTSPAQFTQVLWELYRVQRKKGEPPIQSANLAFTGQKVFEETVFELLNNLYREGVSENLVLTGGCALNSSANGKIIGETPFKELHVYGAPADDGNAMGAAWLAYYEDHPTEKPGEEQILTYFGSEMSEETIDNLKRFGKIEKMREYPGEIHLKAAELLAAGKIIGWAQGRAEYGPRALGNRSILADPRSPDIKDEINKRVKFREEFRPFAPSILDQFGDQYFEHYQSTPYMERTLIFREEVRDKVPGVVHANSTGRLQSVKREWNERYYDLIEAFYKLTGVPIVLNTSFNIMGKPIIHSVEDAIAVFYTTGLDALVIGDILIEK